MRVNRRFLYWGIFLVALGGVLVAADLTNFEASVLTDAMRFWPIAIIAVGLGLVLRRTRFAVAGGMLAAAVPGLVLGGAFALAPHITVDCGMTGTPSASASRDGSFDGPARIDVSTGCGSLVVDTAAGSTWRLATSTSTNRTPVVDASPRSLSIDAGGGGSSGDFHPFDRTHDSWHVTLPTSPIAKLSLAVNAGTGRIGLAGTTIDSLELTTNAGQSTVDLTEAAVARITAELNAGSETIRLSAASDIAGSFEVNAGSLQICTAPGLGLLVRHDGSLSGIRINGANPGDGTWQSADYASATHRADLTIDANLGSAEINPIGGCK